MDEYGHGFIRGQTQDQIWTEIAGMPDTEGILAFGPVDPVAFI